MSPAHLAVLSFSTIAESTLYIFSQLVAALRKDNALENLAVIRRVQRVLLLKSVLDKSND